MQRFVLTTRGITRSAKFLSLFIFLLNLFHWGQSRLLNIIILKQEKKYMKTWNRKDITENKCPQFCYIYLYIKMYTKKKKGDYQAHCVMTVGLCGNKPFLIWNLICISQKSVICVKILWNLTRLRHKQVWFWCLCLAFDKNQSIVSHADFWLHACQTDKCLADCQRMNFAFCENSNQSLGSGVPNGKTKETCLRLCTKVDWTGKQTALLAFYSLHVGHIQDWKTCDSNLVTLLSRELGWYTDCCISSIKNRRSSLSFLYVDLSLWVIYSEFFFLFLSFLKSKIFF